jgi:hypothetical protein
LAAERIHEHFARHGARHDGEAAPLPDASTIEAIVEAAFWASLQREEGYSPQISLAYVPRQDAGMGLSFERALPLSSRALAKLAPAVERPGIHLGVWLREEGLHVWGATRRLPPLCFVVEVVAPGLLVVKHNRGEDAGKFVNVAVLEADRVKIVDQEAAAVPDCPELLTSLLGFDSRGYGESMNVLIELAVSMREHRRGGLLAVTPSGSDEWRESMVQPITYSVVPPFSALAELMQDAGTERAGRRWQSAVERAVDGVAGLTAVDGATVITDRYEVLAFGAKIVRREEWARVGGVIVTEPVEGSEPRILDPAELGGTRHLAAAQFAHDQRDAIALVASQDGRFTVFAWSGCEEMVHAHRIEALLL